jgi:hypothetical protein
MSTKRTNEMTAERAEQFLNSRAEITKPCTLSGIRILNIGEFKKDGESPWIWDKSGERYAIVNLHAWTDYQFDEATKLFNAGEYQKACNKNLSLQMPYDEAMLLKDSLATATVKFVETWSENYETDIIVAKALRLDEIKQAKAVRKFGAKKEAVKAGAETKATENIDVNA